MRRTPTRIAAATLVLLALPALAQGTIQTVVGNYDPTGLPGTQACGRPTAVANDSAGNRYFAALDHHQVYRLDSSGVMHLVAGTGVPGYSGDGGPASSAALSSPWGVAVDGNGNVYIADVGNGRIRKVDAATGTIGTFAGNGSYGFSGDGGPATGAALAAPYGVAADSAGNVYIADVGNSRIRRVAAGTGTVHTVAGDGSFGFSGDGGPATGAALAAPYGVAVDGAGNLFIADSFNSRIRKVDAITGTIGTIAGGGWDWPGDGGPATDAVLFFPQGVSVDGAGNVYIADFNDARVRRVDAITGRITTVAGGGWDSPEDGGPATGVVLGTPRGVSVDGAGNLYIADLFDARVRKVDTAGTISTVAGNGTLRFSGEGSPARSASLHNPTRIAVDGAGNLFIADSVNRRIRKVAASTGTITTVAGGGSNWPGDGPATSAGIAMPWGVAVDALGNIYFAASEFSIIHKVNGSTGNISIFAGNGIWGFSGDGGPATGALLRYPTGVAVDGVGNLYIADTFNDRIRKVSAGTGTISTVAGNGTSGFSGDGGPATSAALGGPSDVAVDGAGNLYIADHGNQRVRRVDAATGTITTVAGNGTFGFSGDGGPATGAALANPTAVTVDGAGNLYIVLAYTPRVRKVDSSGTITTVAGNGTYGFLGDGGPATSANLATPHGVAVDRAGDLLIADTLNNRIRKVELGPPPYDFVGFLSPVDNLPTINEATAGRTIPVKWQLRDGAGAYVSDMGSMVSLSSSAIACDAAPSQIVEEQLVSPGSTVFRYDEATNQFIYNWQSSRSWKGCRQLQLRLADGTLHYAKFRFK